MRAWTAADVEGTAALADIWWDLLAEGVSGEVLASPDAGTGRSVAALRSDSERQMAEASSEPDRERVVRAMLESVSLAGRVLRAHGVGPPKQRGEIVGIHVSDGGVPKRPVSAAVIKEDGVEGDRQADRRYHGRVWQALCLWSSEVIDQIRSEGHPIAPGLAGENLTLRGVDWESLRPGTRVNAGGALVELSLPALPCAKNAGWFADGDFTRMSHRKHPGVTRWYATVLEPGPVRIGDVIVVEP